MSMLVLVMCLFVVTATAEPSSLHAKTDLRQLVEKRQNLGPGFFGEIAASMRNKDSTVEDDNADEDDDADEDDNANEEPPCSEQMCLESYTCVNQVSRSPQLKEEAMKFFGGNMPNKTAAAEWFNEHLKDSCNMKCRNPAFCKITCPSDYLSSQFDDFVKNLEKFFSDENYSKLASKWRTEYINVSCNADEEDDANIRQSCWTECIKNDAKGDCMIETLRLHGKDLTTALEKLFGENKNKVNNVKYGKLSWRWVNEYLKVSCDMKCRYPYTCLSIGRL